MRPTPHTITLLLATLLFAALPSAAFSKPQASGKVPVVQGSEADQRIQYYALRIAEHPRVYSTYLGLALAYLDKARETQDPAWIAKARAATQISRDIMESLEGYKMEARIAAFRHQFAEALAWCEKAKALLTADVSDGGVTSILVEAHMGLGQYDEARKLLPPDGISPSDFHTAAALGHWYVSQGHRDKAAAAFDAAAGFSLVEEVKPLAAWARVMEAGVYLDSGEIGAARPRLKTAASLDPNNRELLIHEAELMLAEGREADAIARYKALLAEAPDAELHRRLFVLAQRNGDAKGAQMHFKAAELLLTRVIKAGEGYTLEALAHLYLEAGVESKRALELARKNFEIKRDRSALEVLLKASLQTMQGANFRNSIRHWLVRASI